MPAGSDDGTLLLTAVLGNPPSAIFTAESGKRDGKQRGFVPTTDIKSPGWTKLTREQTPSFAYGSKVSSSAGLVARR